VTVVSVAALERAIVAALVARRVVVLRPESALAAEAVGGARHADDPMHLALQAAQAANHVLRTQWPLPLRFLPFGRAHAAPAFTRSRISGGASSPSTTYCASVSSAHSRSACCIAPYCFQHQPKRQP